MRWRQCLTWITVTFAISSNLLFISSYSVWRSKGIMICVQTIRNTKIKASQKKKNHYDSPTLWPGSATLRASRDHLHQHKDTEMWILQERDRSLAKELEDLKEQVKVLISTKLKLTANIKADDENSQELQQWEEPLFYFIFICVE